MTIVRQQHLRARIEKREFAQPVLDRRVIEFDHRECVRRRQERHFRSALAFGVADHFQRRHRDAVAKLDEVFFALAPDTRLQPRRQRVDDRHTHAVQTTRNLVRVLVEFAAGMQFREHDLRRRTLRIHVVVVLDARWNPAPVVANRARAIGIERHLTRVRVSGQNLVDGVIDDFVDHVVQTRPIVGIADVHAGALAYRIQALQHLDAVGTVVVHRRLSCGLRAHS